MNESAGAAASTASGTGDTTGDAAVDAIVPRLRQFVVVAREQHLTRAAELLGVPQPTLSRSMSRLEAELGVALFTRPGRSIRLTRHGRALLDAAERTMATLAAALDRITGESDPARGRVALGFLHTLGGEMVPGLLRDFRAERPLVRFASRAGQRARAARPAACGRDRPVPDRAAAATAPRCGARALTEQRIDLFVPAGHRLAGRRGVRLAEAAAEDFIVMEPGYGLRAITDELCRAAGFEPRIAFEGEEADTARGLVGAGLGVSLLPVTGVVAGGPRGLGGPRSPSRGRPVRSASPGSRDRPLAAPAAAFRDFALAASNV